MTVPSRRFPPCSECATILRELLAAHEADRRDMQRRARDIAESSGRDVRTFAFAWVTSVIQMPDEQMRSLLKSHYPRLAEARRRKAEHERATGHSVLRQGWQFIAPREAGRMFRRPMWPLF